MTDVHRSVDAIWRMESARIIAALARMVRDVGLAEELAQDALVAALEQWPGQGVPDNPGAWLMLVAKRRAVDRIRRDRRLAETGAELAREADRDAGPAGGWAPDTADEPADLLRLMFVSCHPVLPTESRVALTLRLLGGLTAAEIARAFLTVEPLVARRIATAKQTLADAGVAFELPDGAELADRLASVLEVVYLIFNEGYSATSGDDLMRPGLCLEALRLGRLLADAAPDEAEVHGLVALMEIQASRAAARTGPGGEPVPLHAQNRGRWDPLLIRRGFAAMLRARAAGGTAGPYVLQAAIAVCHAQASSAEETDWPRIAGLYEALVRLVPSPVVRLNQAVAVGMAAGPEAGLALTEELLADPALRDYHLLPGVRGDLLLRSGRREEARREFERAAALTKNAAERDFLLRRAASVPAGAPGTRDQGPTLGEAAQAFLAREELPPATARSYGQTLQRLRLALGDGLPVAAMTADQVAGVFRTAWGSAAAATWNRHRAAVGSFGAWAEVPHLDARLVRRRDNSSRRKGTSSAGAAGPGEPPGGSDVLRRALQESALRERALWTLLRESEAAVSAVLGLNVEDLDVADRRALPGTSGRHRVAWRSSAAALLAELVGARTSGPLFLSDRRPGPARLRTLGARDICPHTGRGRLSYERAEYLCKTTTGLTLRQLRATG
ncbi:DUF6596 domain-containing protein [Yinghuangia soli]|uniref:RNA polymerase sigma factor n=1 Tax=Yinghuangia soli TaxID=2908204 RepID=A0AA41Q145_9ACTN|nr:DUF6596 domain-containing protein [Yinghuangia soli]MCF2529282.1 RNA polymerase subunit sigma [Yinghuangia soli]